VAEIYDLLHLYRDSNKIDDPGLLQEGRAVPFVMDGRIAVGGRLAGSTPWGLLSQGT